MKYFRLLSNSKMALNLVRTVALRQTIRTFRHETWVSGQLVSKPTGWGCSLWHAKDTNIFIFFLIKYTVGITPCLKDLLFILNYLHLMFYISFNNFEVIRKYCIFRT